MTAGAGPRALWAVGGVSFAESALLPLPVEAVTLPAMLADRARIWRVVLVATGASVAGGLLGYLLGLLLYETLVQWLIDLYGWQTAFGRLQEEFQRNGVLIVLLGALTPLPYKLIAIASGVQQLDLGLFLLLSLLGRGLRFFAFGLLLWRYGPGVRALLDRHAALAGWILLALLLGGFLAVGWLR